MNPKKERPNCLNCGKKLKNLGGKFCNNKCQQEKRHNDYIERWLKGEEVGYTCKTLQPSRHIIRYLREKFNDECELCGWGEENPWHDLIPLEIHHKDRNRSNCTPDNLQLLCPNCHSIQEWYKASTHSYFRGSNL